MVVRLGARSEHQDAGAELPGQGVRNRPPQPDRQDHLRAVPEQQDDSLCAGRTEAAAQPARPLPGRRHDRAAQLRGVDAGSSSYWGHTYKAGYESVLERQDVPRVPRRPVQVPSGRTSGTARRRPIRTWQPASSAAAIATAGSTSPRATRLPARSPTYKDGWAAATTSRWVASGSARPSPISAAKASTAWSLATSCTC